MYDKVKPEIKKKLNQLDRNLIDKTLELHSIKNVNNKMASK